MQPPTKIQKVSESNNLIENKKTQLSPLSVNQNAISMNLTETAPNKPIAMTKETSLASKIEPAPVAQLMAKAQSCAFVNPLVGKLPDKKVLLDPVAKDDSGKKKDKQQ